MHSFEGNYKTRRAQIFDHTEKLTGKGIIQKTREERRQREFLRRQEEAAINIQAFIRGIIGRNHAQHYFSLSFDELTNKIELYSSQDFNSTEFDKRFLKILQAFNLCCTKRIDKPRLFIVCKLLLSEIGRASTLRWLSSYSPSNDSCYTIGSTLLIIIRYLTELPKMSNSSEYTLPVRVLEEIFSTSYYTKQNLQDENFQHLYQTLSWLSYFIVKRNYYKYIAYFVDQQIQSTSGYLSNFSEQQKQFDSQEFLKPTRNRAFVDLLIAPIKCMLQFSNFLDTHSNFQDLYPKLIISALNNILIPDPLGKLLLNDRIIRIIGLELVQLPDSHKIIINGCLNSVQRIRESNSNLNDSCIDHCSDSFLIPSINLLYLLLVVIIPNLITVVPHASPPIMDDPLESSEMTDIKETDEESEESLSLLKISHMNSYPTWTASPMEASILMRCLAWVLMQCLAEPDLPCVRPMITPKPLLMRLAEGEELSDEDDDDDDDEANGTQPSEHSRVNEKLVDHGSRSNPAFQPAWATQLNEICLALRQNLPILITGAFSMFRTIKSSNLTNDQWDLIRASATLHYCLSEVYGLPLTAIIRMNSIYSEYTIYLRSLWHLIQTNRASSIHQSPGNANATGNLLMFNLLASGELPNRLIELQNYLPLVFTFANCLHHRLLCLTDTEICGNYGESHEISCVTGCGFNSEELLFVGTRLRDLMLGLIELAHPDQLPRKKTQNFTNFVQPDYKTILKRVEERAAIVSSSGSVGGIGGNGMPTGSASHLSMRDQSGWSAPELRLQLHCWITLFRRVQRLVFQIYDWDRRCRRRHDLSPAYLFAESLLTTNNPVEANMGRFATNDHNNPTEFLPLSRPRVPVGNPTESQTFWLKENMIDLINMSPISWLQHKGDQFTLTMAGAPFGYYSILNPDRNPSSTDLFVFSNREVRQILILKEVPFVVPFEKRVKLFQILINPADRLGLTDYFSRSVNRTNLSIVVRRTHLYEDAFEKLSKENEPSLQQPLKVRFLNQIGLEELGIDGGGLSREFLSELIRTGFDPIRGFFVYTSDKTLYPNPQASAITPDYLKHYYFLGRILAKAIFEGMLVELQFAYFFLAKVVSRSGGGVGFDYLHSLDPQLYKQLLFLKNYQGKIRDLSLDFTVMESTFGQAQLVELKPNGKHICVTEENRVEYVHLVANYKLNKLIYPHVRAFTAGLNDVICIDWLRLFDAEELQTLISGADMIIDVDDLKMHTIYIGNSAEYTETLNCFWSVLRNLPESDKRSFLRFVTACSRPPMFGFRDLQPPFAIQIIQETERLPTASTCMNLLRLPDFQDVNLLRDRLLYALNANAGFEYS